MASDLAMNMQEMAALLNGVKPAQTQMADIMKSATAGEAVRHLQIIFDEFMNGLKPNEEVAVALSSFGIEHTVVVESVQAINPNLIIIRGFEQGRPAVLVQHLSQMSFLLIPLQVDLGCASPRRKIGFQVDQ
jgi:hypothetical protein